ncbi:MAG TPA: SpoIIE family protein phosphatase, partial [Acidimicrobiia bacterium]|nr:SpoIIE family protein phosphatase [Acidimicrobiia bacterium]
DRLHGALVVAVPPGTPVEIAGWVGAGLGLHLGAAIDTHRNIRRLTALEAAQREVVTQLQEAVRPPEPVMPTAEFGVYFLSADPDAPTGGDLYDWHLLPSGELHVAVIDVVGKGVTATKHALAVMHALRILALEECPLAHLVARASDVLGDAHPDLVATLVVARYHPDTGRVRLVGGGHPPALVVSTNGGVEQIDVPGVPIGWPDAGSVSVAERFLDHDDTLLLYTDGLVEAQRDVLAGLAQLEVAAKEVSEYPARYMARALVERALAGSTRRDDTLALVLRHRVRESSLGPHLGPFHYRFSPTSATVPLARHLLGDWLHLQPVDVRHCDDLLFIATELAANAVTAASGAPQAVELRAWLDEDAVVVEVEDDGPGFQLNPHHEEPPAEAEAGRGLFLVRALADDLTTERRGGCTVTRAVKRAVVRPAPGN